jgi:hypothetical protein
MRTRCNNPNRKEWANYGGRGIKVCSEWDSFENFYEWAINNGYADDLSIERKDVNKGYSPKNCCWIPLVEQARNKTNSLLLDYKGRKISPRELSKEIGVSINTIYTAHKVAHITDFTNYSPRHAKERNISVRATGYEVWIKGKYKGKFKTMEEAIKVRDSLLAQ